MNKNKGMLKVLQLIWFGASFSVFANKELPTQLNTSAAEQLRVELLAGEWVTGIRDNAPEFSWLLTHLAEQTAYRIQVQQLGKPFNEAPLWDSSKVPSNKIRTISLIVLAPNTLLGRHSFKRFNATNIIAIPSAFSSSSPEP